MTDRELFKTALDALKHLCLHSAAIKGYDGEQVQTSIDALKARLAQPEPERYTTDAMKVRQAVSEAVLQQSEQGPIAYLCENAVGHKYFRWKKPPSTYKPIALYTEHAPPQREWVGLTKDEVETWKLPVSPTVYEFVQFIEAKLKEKNT